jgi:ribosomal protein S18 acetylase RimI-like enzyme
MIRYATQSDIPAIKAIANQYKQELGFVNRAALAESVGRRELFVAVQGAKVAGFVNWHRRRDGWSTVYELAVDKTMHSKGLGRALLYAVPCPIRLKCTADNDRANHFYASAGMRMVGIDRGKNRPLNVYEMRVLYALVQGNNKRLPEVARLSGMAYGVRHIDTPQAWPFMLDVEWRRFKTRPGEWWKYLALVKQYQPVMAMCVDYESPAQRRSLYQQIRELKAAGVIRVMICPKFDGAINHIPKWCVVAISVPSSYAGFLPDLATLNGRYVHLLGGTPVKQTDLLLKITGHGGKVISMDGNSHTNAAKFNSLYEDGKFRRKQGEPIGDYYQACTYAGVNVRKQQNAAAEWQQLPLLVR